jgi:glucarate dehydratase
MSRALRLRRARITRVRLPLDMVYVSSMYIMNDTHRTVIELEAEDGVTGIGETLGTPEAYRLAATIAKSFVGADLANRNALRQKFARAIFDNRNGRNGWSAYAGVELAAWDATGKALGASLSTLLGGARRDEVEVICPVPAAIIDGPVPRKELLAHFHDLRNVTRVVDYARRMRERHGFRCFKYKSAGADADWDVAVMSALREAFGPQVLLRFDPNAAYTPRQSIAIARRMEHLKLEFYEDPCEDIEGLAQVRAKVATPIATNMCVIQLDHLAAAVRARPVDVVLADIYMWGGIVTYRTMATASAFFGMEPAVHSLFETGIGTAVNLHLAAALPEIRRPNDSGHHVIAADVVARDALPIRDGRMRVPSAPGIGVAIDADALDQLAVERADL